MSKTMKRDETTARALQRASTRRIRDAEAKRLYEAEMRGEHPMLGARAYHDDGVTDRLHLRLVREA